VPAGVEPDGAQVVSPASQGMDEVSFAPGPKRDGKYTAQLNWYNLTSGPLQVTGANLMAVFPDVTVVTNQSDLVTPTLLVTVTQELDPGSDFAYLGGPPPDHFAGTPVGMEAGHRVRHRHGPDLAARCGSQKRGAGRPGSNRTVLQRRSVRCRRLRIHRRRGGIREQGATRTGRGLKANWTSETPPALVAEPPSPW